MELKEAIEITRQKIIEALTAITAERYDVAKNCLAETHNLLQAVSPEPDINELADVETPLEGLRDQERAVQDSAGNEPVINFQGHISRIEYLSSQILLHVQKENYQKAREDLDNIHAHTTAAQQQLNKFQCLKSQGRISSEDSG